MADENRCPKCDPHKKVLHGPNGCGVIGCPCKVKRIPK